MLAMIDGFFVTGAAAALFAAAAATCRLTWTKNGEVERTLFTVFGFSFRFARYDPARFVNTSGPQDGGIPEVEWRPEKLARPTSGAAQGIEWSFWIYTRRHSWGWGRVRDWALPAYLEITIAEMTLGVESGTFEVVPPRLYRPGETLAARIVNRNKCPASGRIKAGVFYVPAEPKAKSFELDMERPFYAAAGETVRVDIDTVGKGDLQLRRVALSVEPVGEPRIRRLYGRPEWKL